MLVKYMLGSKSLLFGITVIAILLSLFAPIGHV